MGLIIITIMERFRVLREQITDWEVEVKKTFLKEIVIPHLGDE